MEGSTAADMMLRIHDGFRRASAELVAESGRSSPDRRRIRSIFSELATVLHHHHHAEEALLFPGMAATGLAAAELESDHHRLVAAIESVEAVLDTDADASAPLREFDTMLRTHLDAEEAISIPYLRAQPWF